jgi:hypothetical protein
MIKITIKPLSSLSSSIKIAYLCSIRLMSSDISSSENKKFLIAIVRQNCKSFKNLLIVTKITIKPVSAVDQITTTIRFSMPILGYILLGKLQILTPQANLFSLFLLFLTHQQNKVNATIAKRRPHQDECTKQQVSPTTQPPTH